MRRNPARLKRLDDDKSLCVRMVIRERHMDPRMHPLGDEPAQPCGRTAMQQHCRLAAVEIDDPHLPPGNAHAETCPQRF